MSFFNPGKRGALTFLSLILIIGIPACIAYADSSEDTYSKFVSVEDKVFTKYLWGSGSHTENYDASVLYDNVDELDHIAFVIGDVIPSHPSHFRFTVSNLSFESGIFRIFISSNTNKLTDVCEVFIDDIGFEVETGKFVDINLSSFEKIVLNDSHSITIHYYFVDAPETGSESIIDFGFYEGESNIVFTPDLVELIVLVGGILLLIIGTYSLSFIDVGTPGKAVRSAGRSVRSAGRKVSSSVSRRFKK